MLYFLRSCPFSTNGWANPMFLFWDRSLWPSHKLISLWAIRIQDCSLLLLLALYVLRVSCFKFVHGASKLLDFIIEMVFHSCRWIFNPNPPDFVFCRDSNWQKSVLSTSYFIIHIFTGKSPEWLSKGPTHTSSHNLAEVRLIQQFLIFISAQHTYTYIIFGTSTWGYGKGLGNLTM